MSRSSPSPSSWSSPPPFRARRAVGAGLRRRVFVVLLGSVAATSLGVSACATQLSDEKRKKPSKAGVRPPARSSSSQWGSPPMPPEPPFGPLEVPDAGLPCDVDAALKAKCRRCHTTPTRNGAPFPLLTWDDTQRLFRGEPLAAHFGRVIRSGFMPYRIPTNPPVEPLTEAEKQALLAWADAGTPRGECVSKVGAGDAGTQAGVRPQAGAGDASAKAGAGARARAGP